MAFRPVLAITVFMGIFVPSFSSSHTTYVIDKPHQQKQHKKRGHRLNFVLRVGTETIRNNSLASDTTNQILNKLLSKREVFPLFNLYLYLVHCDNCLLVFTRYLKKFGQVCIRRHFVRLVTHSSSRDKPRKKKG